jgi:hypothetical protein
MNYYDRAIKLIEQYEDNPVVFPDSWSTTDEVLIEGWSYRTYMPVPRKFGKDRYIVIEIKFKTEEYKFNIWGNLICLHAQVLGEPVLKPKDFYGFLEKIIQDRLSPMTASEKLKETLKNIKDLEYSIKNNQEELKNLLKAKEELIKL